MSREKIPGSERRNIVLSPHALKHLEVLQGKFELNGADTIRTCLEMAGNLLKVLSENGIVPENALDFSNQVHRLVNIGIDSKKSD